ncbi:hypothetical protein DIPPA_10942 [Diplonema papillatum]|nr:hypothetical protein DIPPA_10942 [Diplonema papillatum]
MGPSYVRRLTASYFVAAPPSVSAAFFTAFACSGKVIATSISLLFSPRVYALVPVWVFCEGPVL